MWGQGVVGNIRAGSGGEYRGGKYGGRELWGI